jgi:hypothetical protein
MSGLREQVKLDEQIESLREKVSHAQPHQVAEEETDATVPPDQLAGEDLDEVKTMLDELRREQEELRDVNHESSR